MVHQVCQLPLPASVARCSPACSCFLVPVFAWFVSIRSVRLTLLLFCSVLLCAAVHLLVLLLVMNIYVVTKRCDGLECVSKQGLELETTKGTRNKGQPTNTGQQRCSSRHGSTGARPYQTRTPNRGLGMRNINAGTHMHTHSAASTSKTHPFGEYPQPTSFSCAYISTRVGCFAAASKCRHVQCFHCDIQAHLHALINRDACDACV